MPELAVEVAVETGGWAETLEEPERFCAHVLAAAAGDAPAPGAVSVLLAADDAIRDLNARFRGKDKPTNVLSFPSPAAGPPGELRFYGDIALALETVRREAHVQGKTLDGHVAHLLVHGFLHLIGHDHQNDAEAERMETRERAILATLGYPDPYRETGLDEAGPES